MKVIKTNSKPATVLFSSLRGGDVFRLEDYGDTVWMKLERRLDRFTAVSTGDGCGLYVGDHYDVEPLPRAELHTNSE